jgi:glycosyltransferase involved in cell wall biosynthesis
MKISAIIPAYNEEKMIKDAILSLKEQQFPKKDFEIVVIDDGSSDRTSEIAKKYADKVVKQKNSGPYIARNRGAKIAKGEILVFIDADTRVEKNFFKEIMRTMMDEKIVGGQPIVRISDCNLFVNFTYNFCQNIVQWIIQSLGMKKLVLLTACCFYRKKILLEEKGFRKFVFDDTEMSFRMIKNGKFKFLKRTHAKTSGRKMNSFGMIKSLYIALNVRGWAKEFQRTGEEPENLAKLRYLKKRD